ncbi:MerR family transcriptional regulator [Streptomyces sp. NBC_00829]|uniref:MerR family transcriptional regulator n=1 Tax=Streptomyces sp. NBC_00829 TaxID=2903679 RepID=UPI0038641059
MDGERVASCHGDDDQHDGGGPEDRRLSRHAGVPTRMPRYYEERNLLHPERADNGYRPFDASAVHRVQQIRGLLDSPLATEIIRRILPLLTEPDDIPVHPGCPAPRTAALLRREADRIQQRIECLTAQPRRDPRLPRGGPRPLPNRGDRAGCTGAGAALRWDQRAGAHGPRREGWSRDGR